MEAFDSTKSGNYITKLNEVMAHEINWDKVKTFEDLILLLKHNVITSKTVGNDDLIGKDKDIKKFFKATGAKILVLDTKEEKKG